MRKRRNQSTQSVGRYIFGRIKFEKKKIIHLRAITFGSQSMMIIRMINLNKYAYIHSIQVYILFKYIYVQIGYLKRHTADGGIEFVAGTVVELLQERSASCCNYCFFFFLASTTDINRYIYIH